MQITDQNNEYGLISSSVNIKSSDAATKRTTPNIVYFNRDDNERASQLHKKEQYKTRIIDAHPASITKENKNLLNHCFELILNANDSALYGPERSNCFDEWKEQLIILSQIDNLSNKQRKILGALITSVLNKDISDFWENKKTFQVLQEATNVLRFSGIAKSECERILNDIIRLGLDNTLLPLTCDNDDASENKNLDAMYAYLLEKSKQS
jgi:hypothetical protein